MMSEKIRSITMRTLVGLILFQLADGDKPHAMRKHITVEEAEKYRKALEK
jgi:hypothetical protein